MTQHSHYLEKFIGDEDFTSHSHKKIFYHLKRGILNGDTIDATILTAKLEAEKVCFLDEKVGAYDYISNLYDNPVKENVIVQTAKDLKPFTARRRFRAAFLEGAESMKLLKNATLEEIISTSDKIYNNEIGHYEGDSGPENIFEDLTWVLLLKFIRIWNCR